MNYDIILAGVGGQGILSVAAVIATAAMKQGLQVRQSEVHGMAQRGGAVQAHLRLADGPIHGDLVGRGRADMILGMEPVEALRYLDFLKPAGIVVCAEDPYTNIPNYPDVEEMLLFIRALPRHRLVAAARTAIELGSKQAANMVLVGAASADLPLETGQLEAAVGDLFGRKGETVVATNRKALQAGRSA